jgi:uncharacterized membrane protein
MLTEDAMRAADLPRAVEERLFDVRLRPHRSLTPSNFKVLILIFCCAAAVSSIPFIAMGAWPVGGFMGLDVVILYAAFRANFRAARAYEDVVVTPLELLLAKVDPRGSRREWRFNPTWVRLDRQEHAEFGVQRLSLHSRGHSVEVAGFLGPDAKADFASGLSRALSEAKRGPRYS